MLLVNGPAVSEPEVKGPESKLAVGDPLAPKVCVPVEYVVHTTKRLPPVAREHRFGSRRAIAAEVALKNRADVSTCWIESLENGWLFLIPNAAESTWLIGVGAPLENLLTGSRVIAPRIEILHARSAEFSSSVAPAVRSVCAPVVN